MDPGHEDGTRDAVPTAPSLAERLRALFDAIRPEPNRKYTFREVTEQLDPEVAKTSAYLAHLVRGTRRNTTAEYLCELANFFQVEPVYLLSRRATDDQRRVHNIHSGLLLLHQLQDTAVGKVLVKAREADARTAATLVDLLDVISSLPGAARETTLDKLQFVAARASHEHGHMLNALDYPMRESRRDTVELMAMVSRLDEDSTRTVTAMLRGILNLRPAADPQTDDTSP